MEQLASIEQSLAKVFKDFPHFPKGLVNWLVENAWWLVLIGVIFGGLSLVATLFASVLFVPFFAGYVGSVAGAYGGSVVLISSLVSLAVSVAVVVINALAIQPLKAKRKHGWDLLFLSWLVSIVGSLVGVVVSISLGGYIVSALSGLVGTVIGAAIGAYLLLELRAGYVATKPVAPVANTPTQTPPQQG